MSTSVSDTVKFSDDLAGRLLSFYIDQTLYGIELLNVTEIINVPNITPVPGLPGYIMGIINLRGKVVPVIDVRLKLGKEIREYDEKNCIIVVVIDEMLVGLIVDCVAEVISSRSEQRLPPPDLGPFSGENYISTIIQINDKVILNLDCEKFFYSDLHI